MKKTFCRKSLVFFKILEQIRMGPGEKESLRELGLSLKEGQINPVLAYPDGILIAGERRVRAALLVGLEELDTVIIEEPLSETDLKTIQLAENMHRLDLNPFEMWKACLSLLELNHDWSYDDVAKQIKRNRSMVVRYLSPSNVIPEVQAALREKKIGIGACYAISKAPKDKQAAMLARKLKGASRDSLEAERKSKTAGNGSTKKPAMGKVKIPLPDGGEITIAAPALTLEYLINLFTNLGKEIKKAQGEDLDARTWAAAMSCKAIKNRLGQGPDGTNGTHHHPSSN